MLKPPTPPTLFEDLRVWEQFEFKKLAYRVKNSQGWVRHLSLSSPLSQCIAITHLNVPSVRLWMPQEHGLGLINQGISRSSLVPRTHWLLSIFLCLSERVNKIPEVSVLLVISKNISISFKWPLAPCHLGLFSTWFIQICTFQYGSHMCLLTFKLM